jgi:hypothetical protein
MTCLAVDKAHRNTLDATGVSEGFNEIFTTSLLLTGSAERAERAVLKGIETLSQDRLSADVVLRATIRAAVAPEVTTGKETVSERELVVSRLPIELRRVLLLPRSLRHAFVLRLLLGLPRDECLRLLQLDDGKLDAHVVSAAVALANMEAPEINNRDCAMRCQTSMLEIQTVKSMPTVNTKEIKRWESLRIK